MKQTATKHERVRDGRRASAVDMNSSMQNRELYLLLMVIVIDHNCYRFGDAGEITGGRVQPRGRLSMTTNQNYRATIGCLIILFATSFLRAAQPIDPIQGLRNQDAAFSLVLEAFREVQGSMIRSDYDTRTRAAERLRDSQKRQAVVWMSDLERHLRQQKLAVQVERLRTTYAYARRHDEQTAGINVPNAVNLDTAAAKLREFVVLSPARLEAPTFDSQSPTLCAARRTLGAARQVQPHLKLLRESLPDKPALDEAVTALFSDDSALPNGAPPFIIVSWREKEGVPSHVVVQSFGELPAASEEPSRRLPHSLERSGLFSPVENWLRLLNGASVTWLGAAEDVRPRQRAFAQLQQGDATFLLEETVEPLHVIAMMTDTTEFLPGSLRLRVSAVVMTGALSMTQWRGEARLVSESQEAAHQVTDVLAGWRAMVQPVANVYMTGDNRGKLRDAVDQCQIETVGPATLIRASSSSALCQRAAVKLMRWATESEP